MVSLRSQRGVQAICLKAIMAGKKRKKTNHKKVIGYINCEQVAFTNNVSWLGDPWLNKGHST